MTLSYDTNHSHISRWCRVMELPSLVGTTQLRQQYKSLALKYHPDKNPDCNDKRFSDITGAFHSLLPYGKKLDTHNLEPQYLEQCSVEGDKHVEFNHCQNHHNPQFITDFLHHLLGESVTHEAFCCVIQQLITKYNISISEIANHIDVNMLLRLIKTVTTDEVALKFQNSRIFQQPINADTKSFNDGHPDTSMVNGSNTSTGTFTVTVSMQDIFDDIVLTVVIPTNGMSIQYKVPAMYETMTFKEGSTTTTVQTQLINESPFEIYEESHLTLVHDITLEQYFTRIDLSFVHLDGQEINVHLTNPHCTCQHYLDGIYCRYHSLGLPTEHSSDARGDLFVCFNIRKDLEQYI